VENAAYWAYDKVKNAWWFIRDPVKWVYDQARKAREELERQVQNQQKWYDQVSAREASARRAAIDLTASAAKAVASAAYWGGQVVIRRLKAAALEVAAKGAKLAANTAEKAKAFAERAVASQREDCQKTLAEQRRLETLANQLAALTGVSAETWLKPGTFTGPFDKATNLQNLITAFGIWNALKSTPEKAWNALKATFPFLNDAAALGRLLTLATMVGLGAFVLNFCPPTPAPTPTLNAAMTNAVGTQFANIMTQTALAVTPAPTQTPIPPTATMEPTPVCITVQSGDNLSTLASKYCVMVSDIQTQNGLSSTDIQIGQPLCIKAPYYGGQPGKCVYPMPPGSVMYTATENNCANIAASFGLTVLELAEYNRNIPYTGGMSYTMTQTGNDCTVQPGAQLVIPEILLHEPSYYVNLYPCSPGGDSVCLSPNDPPELMIAHTLFGEGGSSISSQSSANIMQVALNRINAYYGRRGKSASSLSSEDFAKLLVRVMAMPYDYETEAGQHGQEPAFNAFSEPYPHYNTPGGEANWDETLALVERVLNGEGTGADSALLEPNVVTYCSQDFGLAEPKPESGIAAREVNGDGTRIQFYFNDGRDPNCAK